MDFITLLRRDHETVASLFQQIQRGFDQPETPERQRLFRQLKRELELHAALEDAHVYPIFQQAEATGNEAHSALEAHRQIKTLLDELEAALAYDHWWVSKFQALHKVVEAHIAAEQHELFRKTDRVMTRQEAEELGVAVENGKRALRRNAPTADEGTAEETWQMRL